MAPRPGKSASSVGQISDKRCVGVDGDRACDRHATDCQGHCSQNAHTAAEPISWRRAPNADKSSSGAGRDAAVRSSWRHGRCAALAFVSIDYGGEADQFGVTEHRHTLCLLANRVGSGADDEIAMGVMRGLAESGIWVPEDVAVVGFDDLPLSECGHRRSPRSTRISRGWAGAGSSFCRARQLALRAGASRPSGRSSSCAAARDRSRRNAGWRIHRSSWSRTSPRK